MRRAVRQVAAASSGVAPHQRGAQQTSDLSRHAQRLTPMAGPASPSSEKTSDDVRNMSSPTLHPRMPGQFRLTPNHLDLLRLPNDFWESLKDLEAQLNVSFKDRVLLAQALMHSSYVNVTLSSKEAGSTGGDTTRTGLLSNRWLAMLGDGVLNMIVLTTVAQTPSGPVTWEHFTPKSHEMRSNQLFAQVAAGFTVPKYLKVGPGVTDVSQTMAATALEAIVGAVYVDQGLLKSIAFVEKEILPRLQALRTK